MPASGALILSLLRAAIVDDIGDTLLFYATSACCRAVRYMLRLRC